MQDSIDIPKILVVDDHNSNIFIITEMLSKLDIEIVPANSGLEAIEQIKKHEFALILMDIQMPNMDGFQTLQAIKKGKKELDVPVILITAIFYDDQYYKKAISAGAVDFILKPVQEEVLSGKVKVFVKLYEQKKKLQNVNKELENTLEEKRKFEIELERKNNFLNSIIYSLPFPILVIDSSTKETIYSNDTSIPSGITQKCYESDRICLSSCTKNQCHLKNVIKNELPFQEELCITTKDAEKHYEHFLYPIRNKDNKVSAIIEYFLDITDRKLFENQLEKDKFYLEDIIMERTIDLVKAKEKAEESDKLKTSFLKNISHELRTPLNAIIGFTYMISAGQVSVQEQREMTVNIEENVDSLLNLIDDIIEIAKIEAGEVELSPRSFTLFKLLLQQLNKFSHNNRHITEKRLDFRLHVMEEIQDFEVNTDYDKLFKVVDILLKNAFKFTENGHVSFGFHYYHDYYEIFVEDTGIGIPEEMLDKIFDRFRKVEANNTKFYRGAGLGLTICKKLVEMLGGKIEVRSTMAEGSTFYLRFNHKPIS